MIAVAEVFATSYLPNNVGCDFVCNNCDSCVALFADNADSCFVPD